MKLDDSRRVGSRPPEPGGHTAVAIVDRSLPSPTIDEIHPSGLDEDTYRSLLERIPAVTYVAEYGGAGRWTYVTPQIEPLLGFTPEKWMADPELWLRQVHPDDRQKVLDDEALSRSTGRPLLSEYRIFTQDGRILWVRDEAILVADREAWTLFWQGFMIDITDRRRAEEAHRSSEERFRSLFDNVPFALYRTTPNGQLTDANPALAHLVGYPDKEALASVAAVDLYVNPEDRTRWKELMDWEGIVSDFEMRLRRRDGRIIWVRDSARAIRDAAGIVVCYEGALEDVTDRKHAEEEARQARDKLAGWVDELERRNRDMTIIKEMGDLLQGCPSVEEAQHVIAHFAETLFPEASGALCLISPSRNLVEPVAVWRQPGLGDQVFGPDDCWALRTGRIHHVADPASRLRCRHLATDLPGGYLCVPMVAQGEALGILHVQYPPECPTEGSDAPGSPDAGKQLAVAVAEHVSLALANLRLRETLRSQSIRDPLTGLYNRRHMEESLDRELKQAERSGRPVGVVMLDLDRFTLFNNTHGHQAGDSLLREVGELLRTRVRGGDLACRYGGEEFTLILPEASLEVVRERAEHIREGVKRLAVELRGRTLGGVTVSLGVAMFPEHARTSESIIHEADTALYRAKNLGRDRVEVAGQPG